MSGTSRKIALTILCWLIGIAIVYSQDGKWRNVGDVDMVPVSSQPQLRPWDTPADIAHLQRVFEEGAVEVDPAVRSVRLTGS